MADMDRQRLVEMIIDGLRRTAVHYGLWFAETFHQHGLEAALEAEREAGDRAVSILAKRLAKSAGPEVVNALSALDDDQLVKILESVAANWLVVDGVWFQAVEGKWGMNDAKRVNDSCWCKFSPLEAARIKSMLDLPERGGLDALKTALGYRLYSRINVQEIAEHTEDHLIFHMNRCRVQDARKRKGLEDYPCKSGGLVEYTGFARTIDPRIVTECIACPPDEHPDEWYCAWKFTVDR